MAERRLAGKTASGGFAVGPLAIIADAAGRDRAVGGPAEEATALSDAIAEALVQLGALAHAAAGDGADIIGFQLAMLEDDELSLEAFAAIRRGEPADRAWRAALDRQIADYEAAEDEAFGARASDIRDIRDRVLAILAGATVATPPPGGSILLGEDLTPSRFLGIDWSAGGGIVLTRGSASSHVATLARARGIPMLVGIDLDLAAAPLAGEALLDADGAAMWLEPGPATRAAFDQRVRAADRSAEIAEFLHRPAKTADGTPIAILLNIADPREVDALDPATCDGIGLVRTEFLFSQRGGLPDEEAQYLAYRRLAEWAAGRPVTIRTLDAGADKPITGLTPDHETNPFLGMRGIRISLAKPEVFVVQLRALCRAAVHGAIEIMLPMVALPSELERARAHLDRAVDELAAAGVAHRRPSLGIMVEVPAAAILVEAFEAAFFSIGSNDLTQYVMAAARDSDTVGELNDPSHAAVLRLIARVADHGAATGRKVSLCGDAGGDPRHIAALLSTGLRVLSVSPAALGRAKEAISRVTLDRAPSNAGEVDG